uniref:K-box domain-containing protein n=1 Tax=Lactuca sativa TaxID=4236 RepID=A0A9R1VPP8_LACSA|nr:hypothetical protein LSAT_V11C400195410 [Lactuca sativa]
MAMDQKVDEVIKNGREQVSNGGSWNSAKDIALLNALKVFPKDSALRKHLGEGLGSSTIDELQKLEQQLERSVSIIYAQKVDFYHKKE